MGQLEEEEGGDERSGKKLERGVWESVQGALKRGVGNKDMMRSSHWRRWGCSNIIMESVYGANMEVGQR